MESNRQKLVLIGLVLLTALFGGLFFWLLTTDYLIVTKGTVAFLWIVFSMLLYYRASLTYKKVRNFMQALKYRDYVKQESNNTNDKLLDTIFNEVIDVVKSVKIEKEAEHNYFLNTLKHLGIGIISFNRNGKVEIINDSAKALLGIGQIIHIERLALLDQRLPDILLQLDNGEHILMNVQVKNQELKMVIRVSHFKISDEWKILASFQNIKTELDQQEGEAWQKLIKVLTHEIMNSVTPIKTLTASLIRDMQAELKQEAEKPLIALRAIEKRTKGLMRFVESYRSIAQIPEPHMQEFNVFQLFEHVRALSENNFPANLTIKLTCKPQDVLLADENLVTQILLNMVKNALYALHNEDHPIIEIKYVVNSDNRKTIQVIDNGCGIDKQHLDKIFIPFFTTKEEGSGIGLSVSRQIMLMHNGSISVSSDDSETCFTLVF